MNKERGQISIFFSTSVIVMITMMAFIINIGIFVKAKINLQNATDAAAYAGASVQARQLTNIGYMNWAMRNVFKEWMFKYYVLGGLNLEGVTEVAPPQINGAGCLPKTLGDKMDFTMACYNRTAATGGGEDQYNFPSTCIDFANTGQVGLCTRFLVPGLPRFNRQNVLGMDETTNAFIDSIVAEKSTDCSLRTELNFLTANTWAYNVTETLGDVTNNIQAESPQMAINFMGAFPKAFELALRMRNLESEVNYPPEEGLCGDVGSGVNCKKSASEMQLSHQERPLKAYLSAMRNLGSDVDNEMKNSFTLTEIPPQLRPADPNSLSDLLIPSASSALNKYYLDLQLITANYAPFYTTFAVSQDKLNINGTLIDSEGQCSVTKMGLPVPGYPLHFVKNPDYLTYYAVEGKAKFIGLFNPFANDIVLKAYAAAKPIGGRIGPQVFDVSSNKEIRSRSNRKSSPYISALATQSFRDLNGNTVPVGVYVPGMPVPINSGLNADQFWLSSAGDVIGGFIGDGNGVFFGVPNLVYDYPNGSPTDASSYYAEDPIQVLGYKQTTPQAKAGLYNKPMFQKFRNLLRGFNSVVDSTAVNDGIVLSSAPTLYEAHNWLIPTPSAVNRAKETDSYGLITGESKRIITDATGREYQVWDAQIYGPLYETANPYFLYRSQGELREVLQNYISRQEPAILKYKASMNQVAADIFTKNQSGSSGTNTGAAAARALSDLTSAEFSGAPDLLKSAKPSCASIAGRFIYFYSGSSDLVRSTDNCPTPLPELMQSRWSNTILLRNYNFDYALPVDEDLRSQIFSAYRPGEFRNVNNSAIQNNPASARGSQQVMIRNYYSTKFIPLKSVGPGSSDSYNNNSKILIYAEGDPKSISNEAQRKEFKNPLNPSTLGIDLNDIAH